jgi:hypothetical protein
MSVQIGGRRIYIVTGRKSQTVRVCHKDNRRGNYEWVIRLYQPFFVNEENVREKNNIKGLIKWLIEERNGKIEENSPNYEIDFQVSTIEPSIEIEYDIMAPGLKAKDYILVKQIQWAYNYGIPLIGSKGHRGRSAYTQELNQNLFEPLEPEVRKCFIQGDGNEIKGSINSPAKMQAVHSSSALGVNIFQYWQKNNQVQKITEACGLLPRSNNDILSRIVFEDKYPVSNKFRFAPNIDVVIHNPDSFTIRRIAIECKFSEAYTSHRHPGLKPEYLSLEEIWEDIPAIYDFAKSICPHDEKFEHLHPAQLIKHILGLNKAFGKKGYWLLYLWYNVLGEEGLKHKKEIEEFTGVVRKDGVNFHALSYQELIIELSNKYRSNHEEYIKYITNRYI